MIRNKNNLNNLLFTMLFIVLAFIVFSASNEKKDNSAQLDSSISLCIHISSNTPAVVPTSTEIPIRASFTDENHIILDYSAVNDFQVNLRLSKEFNFTHDKQLSIKPLFSRVTRYLFFPEGDDGDSPSFS